jgi:hypothetical protein
MAVGGFGINNTNDQADYWNGSTWTPQLVTTGSQLVDAVSCASADSCMAVGEQNPYNPDPTAVADEWNGSTWTVLAISAPTGVVETNLDAVSCVSASNCMAVGASGVAEHWNGRTWKALTLAAESDPAYSMSGVSCPAADDCEAVGNYYLGDGTGPVIQQWDGSTWTIQAAPSAELNAVSCASAGSCTAVGTEVNPGADVRGTDAEEWNGTSWTLEPAPAPSSWTDSSLYAVSCASPAHCTAVGTFVDKAARHYARALAETWNGTAWAVQPTAQPDLDQLLEGVSCTAARSCQSVGIVPGKNVDVPGGAGLDLAEGE